MAWFRNSDARVGMTARGEGCHRRRHWLRRPVAVVLTVLLAAAPSLALAPDALPTGGKIVTGTGDIWQTPIELTVVQQSDRLIAEWASFNIGTDAIVRFVQPTADAVALNKVAAGNPSEILGALRADGHVLLVNPSGIVFGPDSQINVGALVASTLDVTDADFLGGTYRFDGPTGDIVNYGTLRGDVVALIAPVVRNEGAIHGDTALAGGTDVVLDFDGDGLIGVTVAGSTVATLVDNRGFIAADGGLVVMTARAAGAAGGGVVNNSGTIRANALEQRDGRLLLLGDMAHGGVHVGGELTAAFVETSAAEVQVDETLVVNTLGGEWLIDPVDIVIDEALAGAIGNALGTGNVTVTTRGDNDPIDLDTSDGEGDGAGDIFVNSSISWDSNILTLRADRHIRINAPLFSTGTTAADGLKLEFAQTVGEGDYFIAAPVNLAAGSHYSTKKGSATAISYTVITELGEATSRDGKSLQGILGNLSGNFALGADIDASETVGWNSGKGFTPLGGDTEFDASKRYDSFSGRFDGLGHTIDDVVINGSGPYYTGLFGSVHETGVIRNVGLKGGSVRGDAWVGSLAGENRGVLEYVYATSSVSGRMGIGGLVGWNHGEVRYAYAAGDVSATGYNAGGLIGYLDNHGSFGAARALVSDSYATGAVSVPSDLGVGWGAGGLVGYSLDGLIARSYATGKVQGRSRPGGLLSDYYNGNGGTHVLIDSFYNTETTGQSDTDAGKGTPLTTDEMRDPASFTNWDFDHVWEIGLRNGGYPTLRGVKAQPTKITVEVPDTSKTYGDANPALPDLSFLDGYYEQFVSGYSWSGALTDRADAGFYPYDGGQVFDVQFVGGISTDDFKVVFTPAGSGQGGLTILARKLSIADPVGVDMPKVYDGTRDFAVGIAPGATSGVLPGDVVHVTIDSALFNSKDVASANTITVSYGWDNPNYLLADTTHAGSISPKSLTIGLPSQLNSTKTYDGTTDYVGTITPGTLSGIVAGDDVRITEMSAAYNSKDVDSANLITIAYTLDNRNYTLSPSSHDASIVPKVLNLVGTRTYDGTTGVGSDIFVPPASTGLQTGVGTETVFVEGTGSVDIKHVGIDKGVTLGTLHLVDGSGQASNYTLVDGVHALTVTPRTISVITGITAADRVYDGSAVAILNVGAAVFLGMITGDDLTVAGAMGAFGDKNVGEGKLVSISGLTLGGADADNYELFDRTASTTATISKAQIAFIDGITASDRVYDGTTAATLHVHDATFSGIIGADHLTVATATGRFADKTAGENKSVSITGLTLGGADAGNYELADDTATATAAITKATITNVTGITAEDRMYDGTTAAHLNVGAARFIGVVEGDSLRVATANGAFVDKSAGWGKSVHVTRLTLGGEDAANYWLSDNTATSVAEIFAIELMLTGVMVKDKIFDGNASAEVSTWGKLIGVIPDDTVLLDHANAVAAFADANPGIGKIATIIGFGLIGSDASNYRLAEPIATTANVMPAVTPRLPRLVPIIPVVPLTRTTVPVYRQDEFGFTAIRTAELNAQGAQVNLTITPTSVPAMAPRLDASRLRTVRAEVPLQNNTDALIIDVGVTDDGILVITIVSGADVDDDEDELLRLAFALAESRLGVPAEAITAVVLRQ